MRVLSLLLAVLSHSILAAKISMPQFIARMTNNTFSAAVASKIDSLKLRKNCIRYHHKCQGGFEPADKCMKFYITMAKLYEKSIKG